MTLLIYMPTLPELFASMCMMRVTVVVKKTHEYHAYPCGHFEFKKKIVVSYFFIWLCFWLLQFTYILLFPSIKTVASGLLLQFPWKSLSLT